MRFLVTAGNTRERIDRVRDWGNIFTGNTGYSIARALAELGEVDLVSSNRSHLAQVTARPNQPHPITGYEVTTHEQLKQQLMQRMAQTTYTAVFMTAAVADYRPLRAYRVVDRKTDGSARETWVVEDVQAGKVKSSYPEIAVLGQRTEKLVDLFRSAWSYRGILVKFKLEVGIGREELLRIGEESRRASGADYLVANTLDMVEGEGAGAYLLSPTASEWVPRAELPARMVRLVREATSAATKGKRESEQ